MPYKCNECGHVFEEPYEHHTTYESLYGIAGMFPYTTPVTILECPYCDSEDFDVYDEEDEYDEEGDEL